MNLSEKQRAELEALEKMRDEDIDLSDIPETLDWSDAIHGAYHQLRTGARSPRRTDVTEKGLEALIEAALIDRYWLPGSPEDYDRTHCVDLDHLQAFMEATQPDTTAALALDSDTNVRRRFLERLKREITNRGIIDVLRNGVRHTQHDVTLFYGTPTPGNTLAQERYLQNRFSVTRQLRYSNDHSQRSLDIVLFVNGLPIATMELKNRFTGQTVEDAVSQYRNTRPAAEDLFRQGRCAVHFAVDDESVEFCTALAGPASVFLPFNKGRDGGRGNPVNPYGVKTAYLWEEILYPDSLCDIIENYAQKVDGKQIWPRYHQLDVVRGALADAREKGAGQKYLVQHSAGSGKSNSIAWLSRQLIPLTKEGRNVFDSIIVITDRVVLDSQIDRTIRQFTQVSSTVGHADSSGDLRRFIEDGKKIIISTVQKFPFILDDSAVTTRTGTSPSSSTKPTPARADGPPRHEHCPRRHRTNGGGRGRLRGRGQPDYRQPPHAQQRQLLRLHRHAQEPDPGTFRKARPPGRRHRSPPALPYLFNEAGHRGRLHHGCADQLHTHPELLQHPQEN